MAKWHHYMKDISMISQLGVLMVLPVIGCTLLGAFLDNYFNTGSLFLIIFVILGVLSAFRNLYVVSMKGIKNAERDRSDEEK